MNWRPLALTPRVLRLVFVVALAILAFANGLAAGTGSIDALAQPSPPDGNLADKIRRHQEFQEDFRRNHVDSSGQARPDLWQQGVRETQAMKVATILRGGRVVSSSQAARMLAGTSAPDGPVSGVQWRQLGPAPLIVGGGLQGVMGAGPNSGEVLDIAIDPRNTSDQIIYIATNHGGVWKSTNGGTSWIPKTDFMPTLSMGAVALDPGNPSIVYAGTGNNFDPLGISFEAVGIYRSTDGGDTWTVLGSSIFGPTAVCSQSSACGKGVVRIVLPAPNVLLVATNNGLYRSVDGGLNFGNNSPGFNNSAPILNGAFSDLDLDTVSPSTVYASVNGQGIFRSTDGGATFPTNLFTSTNGAPGPGSFAFLTFAQSTQQSGGVANNRTMYANVQASGGSLLGIFKSTDAGANWAQATATGLGGCQCGLDQWIAVDPQNLNRVYAGMVAMFLSTDGASTFSAIGGSQVHTDHEITVFSPSSHWGSGGAPTQFWEGTHGGLSMSTNGGTTFTNLNQGLATVGVINIDIGRGSAANNAYTYAAEWDNGTSRHGPGDTGTNWFVGAGGDGGLMTVDLNNPLRAYAAVNGTYVTSSDGGNTWATPAATGLPGNIAFRVAVDANSRGSAAPFTSTRVYALSGNQVFRSIDAGQTFTPIGPTGGFPAGNIWQIFNTPSDSNDLWLSFVANGAIMHASNALAATPTWTTVTVTGAPTGNRVEFLAIDPTTTTQVVVVYSGFSNISQSLRTKHVFRTPDNGVTWTDISGTDNGDPTQNLPDLPINAVVIDPFTTPHTLIVGNDATVLRSADTGATWQVLGVGLPTTFNLSMALDSSASSAVLRTGAYGRSVFELGPAAAPLTSVTIQSSAKPSAFGQPINFTATITPTAATGTVQFTVDGSPLGGPVTLAGGQATSPSVASLSVGTHTVFATYSGDATFQSSTDTLIQVVNKANTVTVLTSSTNPSVFGQPVTFTATVSPAPPSTNPAAPPTGTVQFQVDGTPLGGPVTLSGGQGVSPLITSLSVGNHTVTATYNGDANFLPSSATITQVVNRAPTLTSLTAAPNPSSFGQSVTFTAVVSPAPPSTNPPVPPTGTVQFRVNGVVVATVPLTPGVPTAIQSTAAFTTSGLLPGSRPVVATYSGDGNFLASTSATLTQVVTCTTNISSTPGAVIVRAGGSTCIVGVSVGGAVFAESGVRLFVGDSTIGGAIVAQAPALFGMCNTQVRGAVSVSDATGFVVIGDPGDDGCSGNVVTGAVTLRHNQADVEVQANHVGGAVVVIDMSGTGPFPDDTEAEIMNNTIGDALSCSGNVPPPTSRSQPNIVTGARTGECAGL